MRTTTDLVLVVKGFNSQNERNGVNENNIKYDKDSEESKGHINLKTKKSRVMPYIQNHPEVDSLLSK